MSFPNPLLSAVLVLLLALSGFACDSGNSKGEEGPLPDGDTGTDGDTDADGDGETDGDSQTDGDTDEDGDTGTDEDGDTEEDAEPDVPLGCREPVVSRELRYQPDETFDLGPYLMQPQPTGIVVMWRTEEELDGTVLYGLGETLDQSVSQEGLSHIHEIRLEGLLPDTRYRYQVKSGGLLSDVHHFTTAPDPDQGFTVVIWGDSQGEPAVFSQLLDHMVTLNPYFALGLGDHNSEGPEFELWKHHLFGPARGLFHEVAFYAAIGNHARNHQNWYDLMSFPHPEDDPTHESFYSFTYGNAFFLVIDTDKPYFPIGPIQTKISKFVEEQVASPEAQAARWRFAVSHVPGYAEAWGDAQCKAYGGDLAIREWLHPLLNEHGFHAHFSGHMHGYERGQSDRLLTIISGGGGGGLQQWCVDLPEVSVAHYVHHHLHMEVGCDRVRIAAYDLDGVKFDWVELHADSYGELTDEGPMEGLPDPPIHPDSPHYEGERG